MDSSTGPFGSTRAARRRRTPRRRHQRRRSGGGDQAARAAYAGWRYGGRARWRDRGGVLRGAWRSLLGGRRRQRRARMRSRGCRPGPRLARCGPGPVESRMTSSVCEALPVRWCGGRRRAAAACRRPPGRRPRWGGHRRQLGAGEPAQRDVVDADDADARSGTRTPRRRRPSMQADRHQVVVGEHGGGAAARHLLGGGQRRRPRWAGWGRGR